MRQFRKYGFTPLRIVVRYDLTVGLVVNQHAGGLRHRRKTHFTAVHVNPVRRGHPCAYPGHLAVHRHARGVDPRFHGAARSQPGLREHFLQLLGFLPNGRIPMLLYFGFC